MKFIYVYAIYLILTYTLRAQVEKIHFQHLSIEDGLSQNSVTAIFQDKKGFMWFGTYDGLNKYDGYTFKTYRSDSKNPYSLSQNNVVAIFEDKKGNLWIGTENGLNIYDRDRDRFINFFPNSKNPHDISNYDIQSIVEDSTGTLWVAVYGGGVNKITHINGLEPVLDKIQVKNYFHIPGDPNSLNNNNVTCAFIDSKGGLWFGNDLGISKFDPVNEKFTNYKIDPSLTNSRRITIKEDHLGYLWIGTWGSGIYKFDRKNNRFIGYHSSGKKGSISHDVIRAIYEDSNGLLWVGTNGGGLNLYDRAKDQFIHFKNEPDNPNSLSNNTVISLYEDNANILWVGTEFGGINKFNKNTRHFHHYKIGFKNQNAINSNIITSIHETDKNKNKTIWLGTWEGGLYRINKQTHEEKQYLNQPLNPNSLCNNLIRSISIDKSGIFWIATNGGFSRFDPATEKFTNYVNDINNPESLPDDNVFYSYVDRFDNVWVGTWGGGFSKFNKKTGTFTTYRYDPNDSNSLSNNSVWCIYQDTSGVFWIGTDNGGLNMFIPPGKNDHDGYTFKRFTHDPDDPNSISSNKVLYIYEDKTGTLWLGTTIGLNKFNRVTQQFKHYTTENGLPSNSIQSIVSDTANNLWVSTNKGIFKFNPVTEEIRIFNTYDGLQSNEFGVGSCFVNKDGLIYFGGSNGYNTFYPEKIKTEAIISPIVLTDFQIFNKSVSVGEVLDGKIILNKTINKTDKIELSYKHNIFSFEYASLDYNSPLNNQYAYKMEGFEKDWNYVGNRRFATYINLPAGDYTFRVKAANSYKQWNEKGASIRISIIPPFWQTTWFKVLIIIIVICAFYAFFRFRVRLIHIRNIRLENNVKERTQNLTEANNKLLKEINTRKQIEKELLIAKESAEIASKSKSEFLSNMSHEIRTPMNGVIGLTDLVLNTQLNADQRNFLTMVKYSADQLLNILNDILDFSKIEAGQLQLEHINFELRSIIENASDILIYVLEQKKISYNIYIDNDVPQHLNGDPGRLRQILVNLVSNAFKFTEEGAITIIAKLESRTADTANVHFSVSDTGIGISKERYNTIFQSFTQGDSSTSRKYGGTGLGLSICRQLVNIMNGRIWLESPATLSLPVKNEFKNSEKIKGGPGTTFHFTIPFKIHEVDKEDFILLPESLHGINILIVDDNHINRIILTKMLENLKCNVTAVNDPVEALKKTEKENFNLIITDYQMPGMNGLELTEQIRKKLNTPVILLESVSRNNKINVHEKLKNIWTIDKPIKQKYLINGIIAAMDTSKKEKQKRMPLQNLTDRYMDKLTGLKKHARILLAEDNKINQKVAMAFLKKTGIPVDVAEDGKMVLLALKEKKYDLILMDIQMPRLDGIEATQIIRNEMHLNDLPIIAMTAQTMKGDNEKCLNAGMNDYLPKPISAEKLYKTLNKWLAGKTTLSEST